MYLLTYDQNEWPGGKIMTRNSNSPRHLVYSITEHSIYSSVAGENPTKDGQAELVQIPRWHSNPQTVTDL